MAALPTGGSGEAANSTRVRARLEEMFASGAMPRETMDFRFQALQLDRSDLIFGLADGTRDRAWGEFSKLGEEEGLAALDEFIASDMSRIRNKAAYFMGICKKLSGGGGGGGGLGGY